MRPLRHIRTLVLAALCAGLVACGAAPQSPRAPQASGPAAQPAAPEGAEPAPTAPVLRADDAAPAPGLTAVSLGQALTLRLGETVSLGAGGASVRFDQVVEDSRCPANARCLWQGRVVVAGTLTLGGEQLPFTIGTLKGFEDAPTSFQAGPYSLSIAAIEPYPDTPEGIPQEAYILSLEVE